MSVPSSSACGSRCPIWKFGISVNPPQEKAKGPNNPIKSETNPFICALPIPPLLLDSKMSGRSTFDPGRAASAQNEKQKQNVTPRAKVRTNCALADKAGHFACSQQMGATRCPYS